MTRTQPDHGTLSFSSWLRRAATAGMAVAGLLTCAGCAPRTEAASPVPLMPARTPSPLFDPALSQALLEARDRDRWQKPAEVVRNLRIRRGSVVADIGAGSGYLLPYLSRAAGPRGRVLAQEIQRAFLPALRKRAERLGNVEVILGTAGNPGLPDAGVDRFVLLTVYHEVQEPERFLRRLHDYARPGAELAVIDFDAARQGDPPAPQGHELAEAVVLAEAQGAGWELARKHDFLSSQFYLVFRQRQRD